MANRKERKTMVLPAELKKKEFSKGFKGYNAAEVDEYVSYLLSKYAEAAREYAELEKKYKTALVKLEEAKSDESTFSAMILEAHKMADALVSDAKEKAETMLAEATEKKAAIEESVNVSCDKILATYREHVSAERDKLAKTEKLVVEFKESLFNAYREHVDRILPDEDPENESISTATDEELIDSALDLASRKYNTGAGDIELPPTRNDKADKQDKKESSDQTEASAAKPDSANE